MTNLPHTDETLALLRAGKRAEAIAKHNARVESELTRAQQGAVINLSDLMAAKDEITVSDVMDEYETFDAARRWIEGR